MVVVIICIKAPVVLSPGWPALPKLKRRGPGRGAHQGALIGRRLWTAHKGAAWPQISAPPFPLEPPALAFSPHLGARLLESAGQARKGKCSAAAAAAAAFGSLALCSLTAALQQNVQRRCEDQGQTLGGPDVSWSTAA